MKNVLVCVTKQKSCDRLIRYGRELADGEGGELFIVHIAHYAFKILGQEEESDALEYLYQKSLEYGANLTIVRSNNVLATLVSLVGKHNISKVVLGESREPKEKSMVEGFRQMVGDRVLLIIVPPEDDEELDETVL